MNYVYWIYDDTCLDVLTSGYIGVTYDVQTRFKSHKRKNKNIHDKTKIKIIFEGTREECFKKEFELRPIAGIGWNSAVGGSHGWRTAFKHSKESKEKMKEAWSESRKQKASVFKANQNKLLKGQIRVKQSESIKGENNGMYGKSHSIFSRKKMSESRKGNPANNKLEYYCIYCHMQSNPTVINKYHGVGKKNCIN